MPSLNPDSPVPLYHQLAERLLEGIRSGEFSEGERIPSEPALSRAYGIGRPTVRQATDLLVRRRVVERRRGSGTFVIDPPERVDLLSLAGTLASFEQGGVAVKTEMLGAPARVQVSNDAENPLQGGEAILLSRRSAVSGVPVLLEEIYVDPGVFPGIERVELAGRSLSQWVERQYHVRPRSADQHFRVSAVGPERGALLDLSPETAILVVKRTLHFKDARSAIHAALFCRTDQLVFSQTLEGLGDE